MGRTETSGYVLVFWVNPIVVRVRGCYERGYIGRFWIIIKTGPHVASPWDVTMSEVDASYDGKAEEDQVHCQ